MKNFIITDANGCATSTSTTLIEPPVLTASSSLVSSPLCNGGTAVVSVNANGGTGPYVGTGQVSVLAGSQIFTITDSNGCTATTSINVSQPAAIIASSSIITGVACNSGTATIAVSAIGGTEAKSSAAMPLCRRRARRRQTALRF